MYIVYVAFLFYQNHVHVHTQWWNLTEKNITYLILIFWNINIVSIYVYENCT